MVSAEARAARRARVTLIGILGSTLILGVLSLRQFELSPFSNQPVLDERAYVQWAEEVVQGDAVGDTVFYQDPLYPYMLAMVFTAFGKKLWLVRLLQVGMGTGSVALVYWMGRQALGRSRALLAAGIMALCGSLYFYEVVLVKASTVLFVSALSCALGVAAARRPVKRLPWVALGSSLGLLTLLRGNFLLLLPVVLVWSALHHRVPGWQARLWRSAALLLGILVFLAPVAFRNHRVGGEWVLTTSQGGANFYIGNNAEATGVYVPPPFVRANPEFEALDFATEAEKRAGRSLSPSQVSSFWFEGGLEWIRANPQAAMRLWLHKARLLLHRFEIPDNHSLYLLRENFVSALRLPLLGLGSLWGLAVIGMWIALRRETGALYPALFAIAYVGSIVPFFVVGRYRLPLLPAVALFSAVALHWFFERIRVRDMRALWPASLILTGSLLASFLPTAESRLPLDSSYLLLANAYLRDDQPQRALEWYDRTLRADPHGDAAGRGRDLALQGIAIAEIEAMRIEDLGFSRHDIEGLAREIRTLTSAEIHALGSQSYATHPMRAAILYSIAQQRGFDTGERPIPGPAR